MIAFDQRGTGLSEGPSPEDCDLTWQYPPGRPLHAAHLRHLTLEVARACGEMWRRAGVEGPDHTIKMPSYWEGQLTNLEGLLADDPAVDERFPDLRSLMDSVLTVVEENPPPVQFIPADRRDTVRSRISRFAVELETIDRLREPGRMVTVPWQYERMAHSDFSQVASRAPTLGGFDAMPEAMDAASGMSEERLFRFLRDDARTLLGGGDDLTSAYMADAEGRSLGGDRQLGLLRLEPGL